MRAWILIIILLIVVALSGCGTITTVAKVAVAPIDWKQSVSKQELRFEWPRGSLADNGPRYLSAPGEQWRYDD